MRNNDLENKKEELLEEIFFNKLNLKNDQKDKVDSEDFLKKTYIKIKLKKVSLLDDINFFLKKLEDFDEYKKELKKLAKEREDLKIKIINNLKIINQNLKELYSLMLAEENNEPVIIEEKIEKKPKKFSKAKIEEMNEALIRNNLVNKSMNVVSNVNNQLNNKINENGKNEVVLNSLDEEKILKKLEEELKNLEKELQIVSM